MQKTLIIILCMAAAINSVYAKDDSNKNNPEKERIGIALAGHASTNGFGGYIVYSISDKFSVRAGYENLKFDLDFEFDENEIDYAANFQFNTGSISILADYYFLKHVYLTGGAGIHLFDSDLEGVALSEFKYGDIYIQPEDIGDFVFHVKPASRLSPYAGLGFGRNIGLKNRFAVNFEIGAFYMGKQDVTIEATGLLAPTADPAHGQEELFEKQLERYSVYPVIKLGISYIIF